uniref:Putative SPFH domain / band 7 protein n=1 Tax=viral metagenome TaxID=1070528 RepID=A0A6M3K5P3_9ZZZZ
MEDFKWLKWVIGLFVVVIVFIIFNPFVIVGPGSRGVVMNWGAVSSEIMGEGLHWRTPIVQRVQIIDVQIRKEEVRVGAASKDLQELTTVVALNFHLDSNRVQSLYQNIGLDYQSRIIDPAVQEAVKAATAGFTAEEVITKRPLVKEAISKLLTERLAREYIMVDEVSVKDFDFSKSFNDAIEAKVTAEQQSLQAKNILEKVKYEAEQRISQAKGEAEAIRIQVESISKQGGESYVQMKAIEKWDGKLPTTFVPGSAVPFIKIDNK